MYAVVATAKTRCASVIVGVIQNASRNPKYSGCRTYSYGSGVRNSMRVYGFPISGSQTWRRPNRSKWLMRNVTTRTVPHPAANSAQSTARMNGLSTVQTSMPIGRHCQKSRISARLAKRTKVDRSIVHGTICVHQSLNQRRAMTLCWTAKTVSSAASMARASASGVCAGPSRRVGTAKPPTKAMA